jgi:hypothetical protein
MFKCDYCNFSCNTSYNYKRHLNTNKHLNNINNTYDVINENDKQQIAINSNKKQQIAINSNAEEQKELNPSNDTIISINDKYNCQYCKQEYNNQRCLHNHFIKSCLHIPDKIKNKLIEKHNSNPRTKNKLPLVITNTKQIINNNVNVNNIDTMNNTMNNNTMNNTLNNTLNNTMNNIETLTNNNIQINPFGQETIEHISFERLNEIMGSDTELMLSFKEELTKNEANNNVYIDTRKNLAFYFDENKTLRIRRIKQCNSEFCDIWMNKFKELAEKNPNKFTTFNMKKFNNTYDTYTCRITQDNFDDSEIIIKQSEALNNKYNDDLRLCLIGTNKKSKVLLDSVEKDFNKTS